MKKILILLANPKNTDKLRLDQEVRGIQESLQRAKNREQFEVVTEWAVQVDDLRRALLNYQPTIVHFSGHGSQGQGLVLENNLGQMQVVSTESLARLFKLFQNHVECVLLNACYSEDQAEAIHQHIDYVIGMNQAIGDKAAIEFAVGFYDALVAGRTYEDSFEVGCASIDLQGIPESQTPAIKARKRSGHETTTNKENTAPVEPANSGLITQTAGDNAIQFGSITQAGNLNIQK
jgi:CHAT domain